MKNSNSAKRALVLSALSVLMCIAMLLGTTFAWFTDTASTGVNRIQAGNLKMKVEYSTDMSSWAEVSADKPVFDENALWEPGRTEVVYFRVSNVGKLALRYNFDIAVNSYSPGINADGDEIDLRDYLMFGFADADAAYASREEAITAVADNAQLLGTRGIAVKNREVLLAGEESAVFASVLYMPTTVGNEANNVDKSRTPDIELGITVNATQATVENDSFGNDYDEDAPVVFKRVEYYGGTHTVTESMMAPGRWGAVQVSGGTTTIEASVIATAKNDTAIAVWASGGWNTGAVIINSGTFTQQGLGDSDHYDLIYASDGGKIIINGGTFRATTPQWTLNCKDGSTSTITVRGGTFYQFDPSNANVGAGEIIVPDGYTVVKSGDWYTVVKAASTAAELVAAVNEGGTVVLNDDIDLGSSILSIPADTDVILDLNGKTVTAAKTFANIESGAKLTIDNGTVIANKAYVFNVNGGEVAVNGGSYTAQECVFALFGGSRMTVNDGTFTSRDNNVIATNGSSAQGCEITVNGGVFNANITSAGYIACGVYVANKDTVHLNAGTFNVIDGIGVMMRAGNTTIGKDVVIHLSNTGKVTSGKIGDANIDITTPGYLVVDTRSKYPGLDSDFNVTNNSSYAVVEYQ